ncbi:pyroglutamylated RF-amide peptide receptor-like [Protopterus annectens]|uniref:pyroglutamylated RF-amide peptide receptor-like n=1 Tax=Protopterus annectens TaxID=7888 RepID=UPI001CFB14F0|nr:pyroglutamylated RF-amide peptide receptor-like [Protopterus annectens]
MRTMNITPEILERWLKVYNLTRKEFIYTFNLLPLVYVPQLPNSLKVLFTVLYVIIFVLALVGNFSVLYLVCRRKVMRTVTGYFILSLAVSDLLISIFCIPITLLQHFSTNWMAGAFLCKMVPCIQITAVSTGILTMMCVAIERFQGILYPLRLRSDYTIGRAVKMLVSVWLSSVAIASPMWYAQRLEVKYDFLYDRHYTSCQEDWPHPGYRQTYTTVLLVLVFLIPLLTMSVLYGKVAHELWVKHRVHDIVLQALPGSENSITRKKKRAVKMMVAVVLLFVLCWGPFHIVTILADYGGLQLPEENESIIFATVQLLGFSNSICNPIIYVALNENYKKGLHTTLYWRGHRSRRKVGISAVETRNMGQGTDQSLLAARQSSNAEPFLAWDSDPIQSRVFPPVNLFRTAPKQNIPLLLTVTDPVVSQALE